MKNKVTIFMLLVGTLAVAGMAQGYPTSAELNPFGVTHTGLNEDQGMARFQKIRQIQLAQLSVEKIAAEATVVNQPANTEIHNTVNSETKDGYLSANGMQIPGDKADKSCCDLVERLPNQQDLENVTIVTPNSELANKGNATSFQFEQSESQDFDTGVADARQSAEKEVKPCCDSLEVVSNSGEYLTASTPESERENAVCKSSLRNEESAHKQSDTEDVAARPLDAEEVYLGQSGSRLSQQGADEDPDQGERAPQPRSSGADNIAIPKLVSFEKNGKSGDAINVRYLHEAA